MAGKKIRMIWTEEVIFENEKFLKFHSETSDNINTDTLEDIEKTKKWINENFDKMINPNRKISGFSIFSCV